MEATRSAPGRATTATSFTVCGAREINRRSRAVKGLITVRRELNKPSYTIASPEADLYLCSAFSPDGSMLAACDDAGYLELHDTVNGRLLKRWELNDLYLPVRWCGFSSDGKKVYAVTGDKLCWFPTDGDGEMATYYGSKIVTVAFDVERHLFALACEDGSCRLSVAGEPGSKARAIQAYDQPLSGCSFSPDGTLLLTRCNDTDILDLWHVDSGRHLSRTRCAGQTKAAFAGEREIVVLEPIEVSSSSTVPTEAAIGWRTAGSQTASRLNLTATGFQARR